MDDKFFEIKDLATVAKIFNILPRLSTQITFWTPNQELKFEGVVEKYMQHLKQLYIALPTNLTLEKFIQTVVDENSKSFFASFQIESTNFFMQTTYVSVWEKKLIVVAAPISIFKLQRRATLRIPFKRKEAPRLTLINPHAEISAQGVVQDSDFFAFRILDISVGGLAFAVDLKRENIFKVGSNLSHLKLKIRGKEIQADGHIVNKIESVNDKGTPVYRVGIKFTRLSHEYEKQIAAFVLNESRKLFTLLHHS